MRRRLGTAAVVCAILAVVGTAGLISIGAEGAVEHTGLWAFALAGTILAGVGAILTTVFAIVFPAFGTGASVATLQQATAEGRDGLARVIDLKPTGARLNNAWVYDADLVVDGTAVPAYRAVSRVRVNRAGGGPSLWPGAIVAVVRPRADSPAVVVTAGPGEVPQDSIVPNDAPGWVG